MKLTFDISATEFVIMRDILADIVPPGCRVWVFGSRAKNQTRFNSDLDLAFEGKDKLPQIVLHKLKEAFSDSPLPYRVDVLDINDVSENFQTIIRQQAIAFPLAKRDNVPKLRFQDAQGNDFPEWEQSRLGAHCKITTGRLDANAMVENGKYLFFTCAREVYKIDDFAFDTEALLISGNGANVGYIHYYNGKFNAYQRTYGRVPKSVGHLGGFLIDFRCCHLSFHTWIPLFEFFPESAIEDAGSGLQHQMGAGL